MRTIGGISILWHLGGNVLLTESALTDLGVGSGWLGASLALVCSWGGDATRRTRGNREAAPSPR